MVCLQVYENQKVECSDKTRNGSNKFMCLNALPIGNVIFRKCDFLGVDVGCLEEVYHCGGGL